MVVHLKCRSCGSEYFAIRHRIVKK